MVVVSLQPTVRFMEFSGMGTSSRNVAMSLWDGCLPDRDPAELVRELYQAENRGKAEPSGSQDMAGIDLPESGRLQSKAQAARKQEGASKAAAQALKQTPGKVLAVVNKTTVIVSIGSKQGFKAGDKLNLYETIDTKDDKGVVVFTEEKLAGELTLDSVQEDRSKATYAGTADVKGGWSVKAK